VAPDGTPLCKMDEKEGMQVVEIDIAQSRQLRDNIPVLRQRRADLY
jgi:predicted amidohydrolase